MGAWSSNSFLNRGRHGSRGLTLLEVILALAILGVACAFMAQAMQLATSNAIEAQRQAQGELAAESIMSELVAGIIPLQPTSTWAPVGVSASSSNWSYMVQIVPCEVQHMVGIQVMVRDDANMESTRPADLSVIRWVIDPSLGLDTPPDTTGTSGTDQTGGQSSGTGQTGSASGGASGT